VSEVSKGEENKGTFAGIGEALANNDFEHIR
jgi:hypothetical protein